MHLGGTGLCGKKPRAIARKKKKKKKKKTWILHCWACRCPTLNRKSTRQLFLFEFVSPCIILCSSRLLLTTRGLLTPLPAARTTSDAATGILIRSFFQTDDCKKNAALSARELTRLVISRSNYASFNIFIVFASFLTAVKNWHGLFTMGEFSQRFNFYYCNK